LIDINRKKGEKGTAEVFFIFINKHIRTPLTGRFINKKTEISRRTIAQLLSFIRMFFKENLENDPLECSQAKGYKHCFKNEFPRESIDIWRMYLAGEVFCKLINKALSNLFLGDKKELFYKVDMMLKGWEEKIREYRSEIKNQEKIIKTGR